MALGKKAGIIKIFILVAIVFGALLIINARNYNVKTKEGAFGFLYEFGRWILQLGRNVGRVIGFATKQEWAPEGINVSNATKNLTARIK
jgi:hypothetical protein